MNYSSKINALNPSDMPMVDTHYYKFLSSGGYDDNRIQAKLNYLESFGFIKGTDKVSKETLQILGYILDQYFRNEIAPKIKQTICDGSLPDTLPNNWVFPAPPVCTTQWSESDWVKYAAPYNTI